MCLHGMNIKIQYQHLQLILSMVKSHSTTINSIHAMDIMQELYGLVRILFQRVSRTTSSLSILLKIGKVQKTSYSSHRNFFFKLEVSYQ